ncbi:MAG: ATP-binding protein [Prevotella sp.]|nr:ATP-binding protein [Prevotella sp.]
MIQRQMLQQLHEWSKRENRKPLVLRGARQVGKTTLVDEFSKEFDHYIKLNLEQSADARVFSLTDNVHEAFQYICVQKRISINRNGRTLLFIDEIQEEPRAVAMLRYFKEQLPELFVITAGSRLQSLLSQHFSFPVGRVEYMSLRPCSFLEYLQAMGDEELVYMIHHHEVPSLLHDQLIQRFSNYALIGGMPEVVADYARHQDIMKLSPIYKSLLDGYDEDVEKYAKNASQVAIIRHILRHGWTEAGQTITYRGFGGSAYSSKEIHEAFDVLQKAFLLHLDYPVTSVQAPPQPALTRSPKLIWVDSGIVNFSANIQLEYLQNKSLLDIWRGHAAEQIVAQELRILLDRNYKDEQYFWVRGKTGSTAEVDFVWHNGVRLVPLEVKAGTNSHLRSLHSFMSTPQASDVAVRIWSGPYSEDELTTANGHKFRLLNVPFYYVSILDELIKE